MYYNELTPTVQTLHAVLCMRSSDAAVTATIVGRLPALPTASAGQVPEPPPASHHLRTVG